jgi:uncharacterized protein (DUF427 family)
VFTEPQRELKILRHPEKTRKAPPRKAHRVTDLPDSVRAEYLGHTDGGRTTQNRNSALSKRVLPEPGQESVWDYPRPPRVEESSRRIRVEFAGKIIVETHRSLRVLETSHPPVYYIPPEDIRMEYLKPESGSSYCEWKGQARYYSVVVGEKAARRAAWTYQDPNPAYSVIRDHVAFYAAAMDACTVDGERVQPQEGGFYGGWITKEIVGPFKGAPGTSGW